jgi:hypothetical protein
MSKPFKGVMGILLAVLTLLVLDIVGNNSQAIEQSRQNAKWNNIAQCQRLGLDRDHCFLIER